MGIKQKIFILTAVFTAVLAWTLTLGRNVFSPFWISGFIAFLIYIGVFWVVNFEVNTLGFITALLPPALLVFFSSYVAQSGFELFAPGTRLYLLLTLPIFFFSTYFSMITANIINTWTFKRVALAQVAATVFLFLSIFIFYLAAFSFVQFGILPLTIFGSVGVGGYLVFVNMWLAGASVSDSLKLSAFMAVAVLFFGLALFFWPVPVEVYAAAMTSIFFVGTGIATHSRKKTLDLLVWVEYVLIIVLLVAFMIATARWGIGGRL